MVKVAVLGAGINGASCAFKIKNAYKDFDVTIISEEFSPHTTGDGSGGLWVPYLCGNTPLHLLEKWSSETYNYIHRLFLQGEGVNISMLPVYVMRRMKTNEPAWRDTVFGFLSLNDKQLGYFNDLWNANFVSGFTFTSFVISPPSMITYLYEQFTKAGGKMLPFKVTSLEDSMLQSYDVIVNCTGLGARTIVPDAKVRPVRGQILKVHAPWMNYALLDEDRGNYVLPNCIKCVMGGTRQEDDFNTNVDLTDSANIVQSCNTLIPSLKEAELLETWVGLRPVRDAVRVEPELKRKRLIIHNYGHGGSGLTLFWGCAAEVLHILDQNLPEGIRKAKL